MALIGYARVSTAEQDTGATPIGNSPDAFRKAMSNSLENARKVVQEGQLKFD